MAVTLTYDPDTITIDVVMVSAPVQVIVSQARDAYQLALAEGYVGTRTEWLASLAGDPGPPGANAEIVVLENLAAYLALSPEVQMDGRWYVIPRTS